MISLYAIIIWGFIYLKWFVVVGTFIGWALDQWLETSPLFLLVMFFLGAIAGMLNVWRVFTGRGLAAGYFDEHATHRTKTGKGADRK